MHGNVRGQLWKHSSFFLAFGTQGIYLGCQMGGKYFFFNLTISLVQDLAFNAVFCSYVFLKKKIGY